MDIIKAINLYSYYGKSPVIQDLSFSMKQGEFLSIMGRNGVGKTTLLKTILGLTDKTTGSLMFEGNNILNTRTSERAKLGIGYIPQGREIIPRFTVRENIVMGTYARKDGKRDIPEYLFDIFPILRKFLNRFGGDLSGGQQQQLAIARALAMDPKLLLLDEPTEGIQPNMVKQIEEVIVHLNQSRGLSIILVEQNIPFARAVSDRFILMDKGKIAMTGGKDDLTDELVDKHLTF
jgi:urea transport system ATP-binding protein